MQLLEASNFSGYMWKDERPGGFWWKQTSYRKSDF